MTRIGDPEPVITDDIEPGEELYTTIIEGIAAAPLTVQLELAAAFEARKPFAQLSPEAREHCADMEGALALLSD